MSGALDSQVIAFTLVAAVLTITPGADTLLVVKNALRNGRGAGWATTLGILGGTLIHALLSAIGLSVILMRSATAFQVVKSLGALYLIWIGIQAIRSSRTRVTTEEGPSSASFRSSFTEGLVTNVLNPKVAVFYLAFLPQFIGAADPVLAKSILLACIHNAMGLIWLGGLSVAVSRGRRWIQRPAVGAWISRASGAILVGLGVRLAIDRS
ncbi:MAG: lysine transporter LysE [Gemmatimonadota bacterium]|nr:MAG: lysine transporter LysE [Gemmatimonadota bacterium]